MHPFIAASLVSTLERDMAKTAQSGRVARAGHERRPAAVASVASPEVVIRRARSADAAALDRLGRLDGDFHVAGRLTAAASRGDVLVAEVDGEIEAARVLGGSLSVADPFRPSAVHAEVLALRAEQLGSPARLFARAGALRLRLH